jgi:hypothetical protein
MKKKDLTIAITDSLNDLREGTGHYVADLMEDFNGEGSNEDINDAFDMMQRLVRHDILASQHSYIKKEFDESKKGLDQAVAGLGLDPNGVAGSTKTIYHQDGIKFSKRQNKDGTTTLLTDVLNQLARLGVDKETVDTAMRNAEKPKKGNTYYLIEADD